MLTQSAPPSAMPQSILVPSSSNARAARSSASAAANVREVVPQRPVESVKGSARALATADAEAPAKVRATERALRKGQMVSVLASATVLVAAPAPRVAKVTAPAKTGRA